MKKEKKIREKAGRIFGTSGTKNGVYSVGLTVVVLAVVIVLNLIIGQIPEAYRNIDISSTKIYDISGTTEKFLRQLDKEVDMKVFAVKKDTDERITTFISKYAALSGKISVEWIDPVLHPAALTENNTSENTIVVSCEDTGKTTTVSFGNILVMDSYSYYYYGTSSYSEFDGEGQLTGAVNYVTNETEKTICQSQGHGESSLSDTITDLMDKNNYTLSETNLLMTDAVPDECDLFLMYAPSTDLTEKEVEMLGDYLDKGGKVMVLFGEKGPSDLPVLESLLEEYGITGADGYIADPVRCYQNNYFYIFPELSVSGELADGISSQMVLIGNAHGLTLTDPQRDTVSVSAFMKTSDQAYAVTENSQKQGSYTIGAVAVETAGSEENEEDDTGTDTESSEETAEESRLTVISGAGLIDPEITGTFTTLENTTLFMNAVTSNFEGVQNLSIEAKSLGVQQNTMRHTGPLGLLAVFGIPAVVLIGGFAVWFRRRKR